MFAPFRDVLWWLLAEICYVNVSLIGALVVGPLRGPGDVTVSSPGSFRRCLHGPGLLILAPFRDVRRGVLTGAVCFLSVTVGLFRIREVYNATDGCFYKKLVFYLL